MGLSDEVIKFTIEARDQASATFAKLGAELEALGIAAKHAGASAFDGSKGFDDMARKTEESFARASSTVKSHTANIDNEMRGMVAKIAANSEQTNQHLNKIGGQLGQVVGNNVHSSIRDIGLLSAAAGAMGASIGLSAGVAGAALALLPLGFAALGAVALAKNAEVKGAFTDMANHVKTEVTNLAAPLIPVFVNIAHQAKSTFDSIAGDLGQIFRAVGPQVQMAADGILGMIRNMMGGVTTFIKSADPIMAGLKNGLLDIGTGLGQFFTNVSAGSAGLGQALGAVLSMVGGLLPILGTLFAVIGQVGGPVMVALSHTIVTLVGSLVQGLVPILRAVGPIFIGLMGAIQPLVNVIGSLLGALAPLIASIGVQLIGVIQAAVPIVILLLQGFVSLLPALFNLLGPFTSLVSAILAAAAPLINALVPALGMVIAGVTPLANAIFQLAGVVLMALVQALVPLLPLIGQFAMQLGPILAGAITSLSPLLVAIVGAVGALLPPVMSLAIAALPLLKAALDICVGVLVAILVPIFNWIAHNPALIVGILAVVAAIWLWNIAMNANPIMLIITAIGLLIVAVVAAEQRYHFFTNAAKAVADFFSGPFMSVMRAIGHWFANDFVGFFKQVGDFLVKWGPLMLVALAPFIGIPLLIFQHFGQIVGFFHNLWNDITGVVSAGVRIVTGWFHNLWTDVTNIAKNIWHDVVNYVTNQWHDTMDRYAQLGRAIADWWNNTWRMITDWVKNIWHDVVNFFTNMWHDIVDVDNRLGTAIKEWWSNTWRMITDWVKNIWHDVVNYFTNLWHDTMDRYAQLGRALSDWWSNTWRMITDWVTRTWHDVVNFFANMGRDVINGVIGMYNAVTDWFGRIWHNITDWANRMWHDVVNAFNGMKDGLIRTFKDIANWAFINPINWVINTVINGGINGILDQINKVIGTNWRVNVGAIPMMAEGGVIPGYAPGVDSVPAMLSPGEGVIVPEVVQMLGGASGIAALNSMAPRVGGGGSGMARMGSDGVQYADIGGVIGDIWGGIKGAASGVWDGIKGAFNWVKGMVGEGAKFVLEHTIYPMVDAFKKPGYWGEVPSKSVHTIGDKLIDMLRGRDQKDNASMAGGAPYTGGGSLGAWIAAALAVTGTPASWGGPLGTLVMRESGGNPNAINLTDSNAAAGHPSQGLAQTIPSTFLAYHQAGTSMNITDPVANLAAAINYIKARYGTIFNVQQANANMPPAGYDSGGWLMPGSTMAHNATGSPEMVLPPNMSETIMRMYHLFSGGGGGGGHHWGHHHRRNMWPGHDWHHEVHDPGSHIYPWLGHSQLGRFLRSGQHDNTLGFSQLMQGDKSMLNALGVSGSGSPFAGLFLNSNFGRTGMGNAYEQNALTWGTRSGHGQGNRHTDGGFLGRGHSAMDNFVGGLFGSGGSGGYSGGGGYGGGGDSRHMYIDMRGCQVMSDYDMDILIGKFSRRVAQWGFPSAGVQIRR